MKAFFDRHAVDRQAENWGNPNDPSAGYVAHLLWGGDAGYSWARARVRQINAADKKKSITKQESMQISFDQADEDAIRALQSDQVQTNNYNELSTVLATKLNQVIADSIVEGRSIPNTVAEMQRVINTETYKLTRIARTEMINITNEGRLASYRKQEKVRKKPFRYTLVVASGARTCDAHKDIGSQIPAEGMLIDDLIALQQRVGATYGFTLRGNSLLHPNQRTVLTRVP